MYSAEDLKTHVCWKTPDLHWVADKSKVANIVKAEGFTFVDDSGPELLGVKRSSVDSKTVIFVTAARVKEAIPDNTNLAPLEERQILAGGLLLPSSALPISQTTTQFQIRKWLIGDTENCAVCYEDLGVGRSMEHATLSCVCCTALCFGCRIDLLSMSDVEMTCYCPNCRREVDSYANFEKIYKVIDYCFLEKIPVGKLGDARLAFIEKMTSIDLTLSRKRVLRQLMCLYKENPYNDRVRCEAGDIDPPWVRRKLYDDFRDAVDRLRKKKVASASADSSSAVGVQPKGGCANCGKRFWDKSDWRRAPKCAKCRRIAYCSAKCRKKHAKAHAAKSNAKGPKRLKAKRKPKKGNCAPY